MRDDAKRLEVIGSSARIGHAALSGFGTRNSLAWEKTEEAARRLGINLRSQEVREPRISNKPSAAMTENLAAGPARRPDRLTAGASEGDHCLHV